MQFAQVAAVALCFQFLCGSAFAQSPLYNSCVETINKDKDNTFCGGLLKGFELGYDIGYNKGVSLVFSSTTSSGLVVGLHGTEIGIDRPFVFQPAGDESAAVVFEPADGAVDAITTIGKGPYSFDLEKYSTSPLSNWLRDNSATVDVEKLEALQGALGELSGDSPVIYEIPTLGQQ